MTFFCYKVAPTKIPVEGGLRLRIPGYGLILNDGDNIAVEIAGKPCENVTSGSMPPDENGKSVDV